MSMYREHERVTLDCSDKSLTKQSFAAECDINTIMRKFEKTGLIDHNAKHGGSYGDFLAAPEYHEACNAVLAADAAFMSLPSGLRKRFNNDPAAFLEFAQDPANQEAMAELGLTKPPRIIADEGEAEKPTEDSPDPKPSEKAK